MRSTKDLKDIVTDIRGKSKGRFTEAGKMTLMNPSTLDISQNDGDSSFVARMQTGGVTYGQRGITQAEPKLE